MSTTTCAVCHEPIARGADGEWMHPHSGDVYCGTGDGATAYPDLATILRGAALHDATPRDDIVALEVAGRTFTRELPLRIPDTHDLPNLGQVSDEVHAAVEAITGKSFPTRLSPPQARSALKRWAVATRAWASS